MNKNNIVLPRTEINISVCKQTFVIVVRYFLHLPYSGNRMTHVIMSLEIRDSFVYINLNAASIEFICGGGGSSMRSETVQLIVM